MITNLTKEDLIKFEEEIEQIFNSGKIRAPVHSDNGNEEQLLEIFKDIKEEDYVCGTWRQHFKCLLKGVSPEQLKQDINAGKSITLCYKEYNIFSSAIVGGIIPIALGIAFDLKRKQSKQKVWCFIGDMSSTCGVFSEALEYARNFKLPITFIVEDNNKSVCTDTRKVWNTQKLLHEPQMFEDSIQEEMDFENGRPIRCDANLIWYKYQSKWPHAGFNVRINF